MHILITGGGGYIGSVMVPFLLGKGYSVTVVDNFMYNQSSLLDCVQNSRLKIVRGDVTSETLMKEQMKDADFIFPLACLTGAPLCSEKVMLAKAVNYTAIQIILKLRSKMQKIIFPTTNSGYGIGEEGIYCTEKTVLRPVSLYGRLKVGIEKEILDSGESITLRLATVFGASPRMRLDLLVNDFVYRACNDKAIILFEAHFKRNYLYILDVAKAFFHSMKNFDVMKNESYNVGLDDANLSKLELCEKIKEQIPEFVFIQSEISHDPDKRNYIVSNEKIAETGFKACGSIKTGIKELKTAYQIIKQNSYKNI